MIFCLKFYALSYLEILSLAQPIQHIGLLSMLFRSYRGLLLSFPVQFQMRRRFFHLLQSCLSVKHAIFTSFWSFLFYVCKQYGSITTIHHVSEHGFRAEGAAGCCSVWEHCRLWLCRCVHGRFKVTSSRTAHLCASRKGNESSIKTQVRTRASCQLKSGFFLHLANLILPPSLLIFSSEYSSSTSLYIPPHIRHSKLTEGMRR